MIVRNFFEKLFTFDKINAIFLFIVAMTPLSIFIVLKLNVSLLTKGYNSYFYFKQNLFYKTITGKTLYSYTRAILTILFDLPSFFIRIDTHAIKYLE